MTGGLLFYIYQTVTTIKVDHLERQNKGYKNWVIGNIDDVQPVNSAQVVLIDVVGDCNFITIDVLLLLRTMARISKLHLLNSFPKKIVFFHYLCFYV